MLNTVETGLTVLEITVFYYYFSSVYVLFDLVRACKDNGIVLTMSVLVIFLDNISFICFDFLFMLNVQPFLSKKNLT